MAKNYQKFSSLLEALNHAKSLGATHYTVLTPFRGRPTCLVFRRRPDGFQQWQQAQLENIGYHKGMIPASYWAVSEGWTDVRKGLLLIKAKPITEMPEGEAEDG